MRVMRRPSDRSRRPKSEQTAAASRGSKKRPLDVLDPTEKAAVLSELLRRHRELRVEADDIATRHMAATSSETVAESVEQDLRSLTIFDLGGRAGRQPWGYKEPTEAAWEVLGETTDPRIGGIKRLLALGMTQPATATALGVIAGLYRCKDCDGDDGLLSWAPDFPLEHAEHVIDLLAEQNVTLPPDSVSDAAPGWVDPLTRAKKPRRR